ncbi:MAG: esterase-like activity of phytase family protein [Thiothrix sp.]|nr:MAG: esterase-like activity of phytase family protein [Thiothrix sp.]
MQIKLLGTLVLPMQTIDKLPLTELSGLAWDEDESILYAVSDKGNLFHLHPQFKNGLLHKATITSAYPLKDKTGKKLRGIANDSEGITLINADNGKKGDSELLISFEGKPRLEIYTNKGEWRENIKLHDDLKKRSHYQSKNKALEAVTQHPKFGTITTPEYALKNTANNEIILYASTGKRWRVSRYARPGSAVVAIETLPDGSLLLLERVFESALQPIEIVLRQTWLDSGCEVNKSTLCKSKILSIFNSAKGWSIDNYEGLTRHQKNRFFISSDDNEMWFQRTLLSYFEITSKNSTSVNSNIIE